MLPEEIEIINAELKARSEKDPSLKLLRTIPGCGAILAAMIIAEIKDINRFRSSSALARYTGVAPRQHSSSTKAKKYTDRRGNRKLNYALFQLAVSQTQLRKTKQGSAYYQKKLSKGKTKLHAIRCLKRRLVNIIYYMLKYQKSFTIE